MYRAHTASPQTDSQTTTEPGLVESYHQLLALLCNLRVIIAHGTWRASVATVRAGYSAGALYKYNQFGEREVAFCLARRVRQYMTKINSTVLATFDDGLSSI